MTTDEALHVRDMSRSIRERMAADGLVENPLKDEAIDILAAEVRALRESHAEAVEGAHREGMARGYDECGDIADSVVLDRAWLASEAKQGLEGEHEG